MKVYIVYKNDIMIKYEGWGRECGDEEVIKAGAPTHTHTHTEKEGKKKMSSSSMCVVSSWGLTSEGGEG